MTDQPLIHDGYLPTPYGQQIKVFRRPDLPPEDDAALVFSVESAALLAGIYDPAERKRFAAETDRQTKLGSGEVRLRFEDFGGHVVPKVPLPRPSFPVYPCLPRDDEMPIEAWITGLMDRHRWCDRADYLVGGGAADSLQGIIGSNLDQLPAVGLREEAMFCLGLSMILTGALEHVPEPEIDCIEAAAFYALTDHWAWREAGLRWLTPFRETWFRDWRDARPTYTRFAGLLAMGHGLPDWLGAA